MIELQMERDGPFRLLEASLSEHGGTEHNDRGVQRAQGVLESEAAPFQGRHGMAMAE